MEFWASFLSGVIAGLVFITLHYAMLWLKGQSLTFILLMWNIW
jgi:hypothetical protein